MGGAYDNEEWKAVQQREIGLGSWWRHLNPTELYFGLERRVLEILLLMSHSWDGINKNRPIQMSSIT